MAFDDISQQIWGQMQTGSSTPVPYKASFYGIKELEEGIDYKELLFFLNAYYNHIREEYNYKDFAAGYKLETSYVRTADGNQPRQRKIPENTKFRYTDEQGTTRPITLKGILNKRPGYLESNWGYVLAIDPFDEKISITLRIYYLNTMSERKPVLETTDDSDFTIPKKFVAIQLITESLVDFCDIIGFIWGDEDKKNMQNNVTKAIANRLRYYKDPEHLNFLYSNIPDFCIPMLGEKLTLEEIAHHLPQLYNYDVSGPFSWFKDSSTAIINFFRIIGSKNPDQLLKLFVGNQESVRLLYYAMNGVSTVNGQTASTSILFANMIYSLCVLNAYKGLTKKESVFRIGKDYELDSNVLQKNDPKGKILLVQYQKKQKFVTHTFTSPTTGASAGSYSGIETVSEEFFKSFYSPMDLVTLIDMDSKDKTRYLVPAIYVKALSDEEEWKNIKKNMRLGADLLAIIIGIASLGTASPLLLTLALVDIGLSTADMIVAIEADDLMKTEEGREFLEKWDQIMLVGGIITAVPGLVQSTFRIGAKLFATATVIETKNFLRASLMKIMLEVNIVNFTKNSVKILETTTEVIQESSFFLKESQIINFSNAGVVFVSGEKLTAKGAQKVFGVVYNGKLIAEGTGKAVKEKLKNVLGLTGNNLVKQLDKLAGINHFLPENCEIFFSKDNFVFLDLTTNETVGFVTVNDGYLEFAIYRKELKTSISGSQVYDSLTEHVKLNQIKYKGIKGLWAQKSDNTAKFNEAIAKKFTPEEAAFKTWSGMKAREEGFTKVNIDKLEPDTPPYTSITVTFHK